MAALTNIDLVYQLIQDDVKRPDMQDKIRRRIHRAALNYHRMDSWKRDFVETVFFFDNPITAVPNQPTAQSGANALFMNWAGQVQSTINVQVLDTTELERFRSIGYLRKYMTVSPYGTPIYDPTTGQQGTVQGGDLTEGSPDSMFDGYGYDKTDKFYRSGENIMINSSTPLDRVYIGYFKDPLLNLGNNDDPTFHTYISWIIDKYPDLIVADVKAKVFTDIGKVEEANAITRASNPLNMGELPTQILRLQTNEVRVSLR